METKKDFDAVEMMRTLRTKVGKELNCKSYQDQKNYIRERLRDGDNKSENKNKKDRIIALLNLATVCEWL
jgi:hypothetical protein